MCLNIGTPKDHHFSFGTNEKVVVVSQYLSTLGYYLNSNIRQKKIARVLQSFLQDCFEADIDRNKKN